MGLFDFLKKKRIDKTVNQSSKIEETAKQTPQFNESSRLQTVETEKSFYMEVEDVFSITGRGTVAAGYIQGGSIQKGDSAYIIKTNGETIKTVILGITTKDKVEEGKAAGLILSGISRDEVSRGDFISATKNMPNQAQSTLQQKENEFYLEVSNKYTAFGKLVIEGRGVKNGHQLSVGDKVYVYSEKGSLKYEMIGVSELEVTNYNTQQKRKMQTITECNDYIAIVLNGLQNVGDIDYRDIISLKKLEFENTVQDEQPTVEKALPEAKTYNHADRRTHINMATNDLAGMLSLSSKREWVRNVGQDLYNAHGFDAMQEVFINVKNRRPEKQIELSQIWDGVGGWAD